MIEFNACHIKSIHIFFKTYVFIYDGVKSVCGPLERVQIFSQRASRLSFRAFSSRRSSLTQTFLKVVQTWKLSIYPYSLFGDYHNYRRFYPYSWFHIGDSYLKPHFMIRGNESAGDNMVWALMHTTLGRRVVRAHFPDVQIQKTATEEGYLLDCSHNCDALYFEVAVGHSYYQLAAISALMPLHSR